MKSRQEFSRKVTGYYPTTDRHFAYGVNGYLYSSPLDLFFNSQCVDSLLRLLAERSESWEK
jgi:hypothetical protein